MDPTGASSVPFRGLLESMDGREGRVIEAGGGFGLAPERRQEVASWTRAADDRLIATWYAPVSNQHDHGSRAAGAP